MACNTKFVVLVLFHLPVEYPYVIVGMESIKLFVFCIKSIEALDAIDEST